MKSYVVLGLGMFGRSFAKTLAEMGHEVLGVDSDERTVQDFSNIITHTVQADMTSEDFLKSIDVVNFDAAIVSVGSNIQTSIMATVLLKELGAAYILVKAQDDFQAKILYKIGADRVILPEKDMAIKAAHNLAVDNFFDALEISPDYSIASIIPPNSWHGKTLGGLAVRAKYNVNVIAVKNSVSSDVIPHVDTVIRHGDTITIMGKKNDIRRLTSIK